MTQDTRARRQNQMWHALGSLASGAALFVIAGFFAAAGLSRGLRPDHATLARTYARLTGTLSADPDTARRARAVEAFRRLADSLGAPVTDYSSATFLYFGAAGRVTVAGDFNRWNPEADPLTRVPGTNMFSRSIQLPPDARVEYKLVVDSGWTLDPLNPRTARGGFGLNSELRMPAYAPDSFAVSRAGVPRGHLDTLKFTSRLLDRTHPVIVYTPHDPGPHPLPVLYVLDGGEYLSIARMHRTLDNLLAERRIHPLFAVFVDARTDPANPASNRRMEDYVLDDRFIHALVKELVPLVSRRYNAARQPRTTGIMGASLGGLTSTYAVWRAPDVFGVAIAQSPSYGWKDERILGILAETPTGSGRFWIDTGTINDAQDVAPKMRDLLRSQGREVAYTEVPEGHNWTSWQSRIPAALRFFAGAPQ